SDAVSAASGSPRSIRSSSWRASSWRRMPRRRCVGITPTQVTPAVGTNAPPGTVRCMVMALVVPTTWAPSTATVVRSSSRKRGPAFYHLREIGHAHLVCQDCGAITDVPDRLLDGLRDQALDRYGFTVDTHHAAVLGRCARCVAVPR